MICYRSKVQVKMQIQIIETLKPFSNTHCVHWEGPQCLTWLLVQPSSLFKGQEKQGWDLNPGSYPSAPSVICEGLPPTCNQGALIKKIIDPTYSHRVENLPWNRENSLCKSIKELSNIELLKVPEV